MEKYAIKYLRIRINSDTSILVPKKLVKGNIKDKIYFETNKEIFPYINNLEAETRYFIGEARSLEEIKKAYEYPDLNGETHKISDDEAINFYFQEEEDKVLLVKDDYDVAKIDLYDLFACEDKKAVYSYIDGESCIQINSAMIDTIERENDPKVIHELFKVYSDRLTLFEDQHKRGELEYQYEKNGEVSAPPVIKKEEEKELPPINPEDLRRYLSERILGHDAELKKISTILALNYSSSPKYKTESILIPGPTGTGKTATFECAAEYFDLPFKNVNTCNLVPDGIVGTTVEDEFYSILQECDFDQKRAERAIICFDEFDKLGKDSLDIKETLKNTFLKVIEGAKFPINRQFQASAIFDTTMSSKIFLGTFKEALEPKKQKIGYANTNKETNNKFDLNKLYDNGYYDKELISRINHVIPYGPLSKDTMKRIILESKLSTYIKKKERLKEQFGIEIIGEQDYVNSIIEKLDKEDKSVRDLNNIITDSFIDAEYEILCNLGKYKKLVLTKDTVSKGVFDLS